MSVCLSVKFLLSRLYSYFPITVSSSLSLLFCFNKKKVPSIPLASRSTEGDWSQPAREKHKYQQDPQCKMMRENTRGRVKRDFLCFNKVRNIPIDKNINCFCPRLPLLVNAPRHSLNVLSKVGKKKLEPSCRLHTIFL